MENLRLGVNGKKSGAKAESVGKTNMATDLGVAEIRVDPAKALEKLRKVRPRPPSPSGSLESGSSLDLMTRHKCEMVLELKESGPVHGPKELMSKRLSRRADPETLNPGGFFHQINKAEPCRERGVDYLKGNEERTESFDW